MNGIWKQPLTRIHPIQEWIQDFHGGGGDYVSPRSSRYETSYDTLNGVLNKCVFCGTPNNSNNVPYTTKHNTTQHPCFKKNVYDADVWKNIPFPVTIFTRVRSQSCSEWHPLPPPPLPRDPYPNHWTYLT